MRQPVGGHRENTGGGGGRGLRRQWELALERRGGLRCMRPQEVEMTGLGSGGWRWGGILDGCHIFCLSRWLNQLLRRGNWEEELFFWGVGVGDVTQGEMMEGPRAASQEANIYKLCVWERQGRACNRFWERTVGAAGKTLGKVYYLRN